MVTRSTHCHLDQELANSAVQTKPVANSEQRQNSVCFYNNTNENDNYQSDPAKSIRRINKLLKYPR